MKLEDELEMEVFKSGDYGAKGSYSEADLQAMADDYRADLLEAPLTFDHAQTGPAYGWVSRMRREGDRLVAVLKGVPQAVREMVRSGAYKRRSVELFRTLPQTGRPYLRAVSLLGAATPEVKGLRDICFSANDGNGNAHEQVELSVHPDVTSDLNAVKRELVESKLSLMFAELRADGFCLADRDAEAIRHIFATHDGVVNFADGSAQATLDWMSGFLKQVLLRAPLGEAAPPTGTASRNAGAAAVGIAFSEKVSPQSAAIHQRALQLQAATPSLSYRDALLQVG